MGEFRLPQRCKEKIMSQISNKIKEGRVVTTRASLTGVDSAEYVFMEAGSDDVVVNLPSDLITGVELTFVQANATAGSTCRITPSTPAKIVGYVSQQEGGNADATTADGLVSVLDGTAGKYVQLTKATGHQGDWIKLVCNGSDWYVIGGVGTFAHES